MFSWISLTGNIGTCMPTSACFWLFAGVIRLVLFWPQLETDFLTMLQSKRKQGCKENVYMSQCGNSTYITHKIMSKKALWGPLTGTEQGMGGTTAPDVTCMSAVARDRPTLLNLYCLTVGRSRKAARKETRSKKDRGPKPTKPPKKKNKGDKKNKDKSGKKNKNKNKKVQIEDPPSEPPHIEEEELMVVEPIWDQCRYPLAHSPGPQTAGQTQTTVWMCLTAQWQHFKAFKIWLPHVKNCNSKLLNLHDQCICECRCMKS